MWQGSTSCPKTWGGMKHVTYSGVTALWSEPQIYLALSYWCMWTDTDFNM